MMSASEVARTAVLVAFVFLSGVAYGQCVLLQQPPTTSIKTTSNNDEKEESPSSSEAAAASTEMASSSQSSNDTDTNASSKPSSITHLSSTSSSSPPPTTRYNSPTPSTPSTPSKRKPWPWKSERSSSSLSINSKETNTNNSDRSRSRIRKSSDPIIIPLPVNQNDLPRTNSGASFLEQRRSSSSSASSSSSENEASTSSTKSSLDTLHPLPLPQQRTNQSIPPPPPLYSRKSTNPTKTIDIGAIFGLDVGGTLCKLIYFEKRDEPRPFTTENYNEDAGKGTGKGDRRFKRGERCDGDGEDSGSSPSSSSVNSGSNALRGSPKRANVLSRASSNSEYSSADEKDTAKLVLLELAKGLESDLIMLNENNNTSSSSSSSSPKPSASSSSQPSNFVRLTSESVDSGLRRVSSLQNLSSADHIVALDQFYNFASHTTTFGSSGVKEVSLSFFSRALGGELHFIRFETTHMSGAMDLISNNNLHHNIKSMGCTGGGAHKFSDQWSSELGIEIVKQGEMDSLVVGLQFVLAGVVGECFTFKPQRKTAIPRGVSSQSSSSSSVDEAQKETQKATNSSDWSRKVQRDTMPDNKNFPYIVVSIGTGVSIIRVDGPGKFERISGSTIGGGTYWGLCRLLTDVENFDEVLNLAERGDSEKIDMLVGDIYGHNSDALDKLKLPSTVVASSFGKLCAKPDPAEGLTQEDLARALLMMTTNNIGHIAFLNAQLHKAKQIYFVGNFLRHNNISCQRLTFAIDYWSNGSMEALFLEHEGYLGALGAFLLGQRREKGENGSYNGSSSGGSSASKSSRRKRDNTTNTKSGGNANRNRAESHDGAEFQFSKRADVGVAKRIGPLPNFVGGGGGKSGNGGETSDSDVDSLDCLTPDSVTYTTDKNESNNTTRSPNSAAQQLGLQELSKQRHDDERDFFPKKGMGRRYTADIIPDMSKFGSRKR